MITCILYDIATVHRTDVRPEKVIGCQEDPLSNGSLVVTSCWRCLEKCKNPLAEVLVLQALLKESTMDLTITSYVYFAKYVLLKSNYFFAKKRKFTKI